MAVIFHVGGTQIHGFAIKTRSYGDGRWRWLKWSAVQWRFQKRRHELTWEGTKLATMQDVKSLVQEPERPMRTETAMCDAPPRFGRHIFSQEYFSDLKVQKPERTAKKFYQQNPCPEMHLQARLTTRHEEGTDKNAFAGGGPFVIWMAGRKRFYGFVGGGCRFCEVSLSYRFNPKQLIP